MKAHIVGGGFGGLAAAAYLIRNAGPPARILLSTKWTSRWVARSR
jgi:cation diffusion facilitator CzcD-associated flavoprotein CzcO